MSTVMEECEQAARADGLAAGLAAALAGTAVTATAPGRYAAVAARAAPDGVPLRRHSLADREDVVFAECPGGRPAAGDGLAEIARRLAAVRLGLTRRLLDQAAEHLSGRMAGEEPLARKQLVVGTFADVMAELEMLRLYARDQHEPGPLGDLHGQLDELGWQVTKLFGAAGYIADHPARALYVAALAAGTWVDRREARP